MPMVIDHGAALIALTIDEVGMAKTAERKVEVAKVIYDIAVGEYGLDPELLIFDVPRSRSRPRRRMEAVRDRNDPRHPRREGRTPRREDLARRFERLVRRRPARARRAQLGVPLPLREAGSTSRWSTRTTSRRTCEIDDLEKELANDLVWNKREDALERFIAHFESKGATDEGDGGKADPTEGMTPEEALHWHILRRKKDGVEAWIDRSVEKIGGRPHPQRRPAARHEGSRRQVRRRELILPFVLQSAEVMKKAVAQLENYLERTADYTKARSSSPPSSATCTTSARAS